MKNKNKLLKNPIYFCVIILFFACSPQIKPIVISTQQMTATSTPVLKNTPTTMKYRVSFLAFHDLNGNGSLDNDEQPLEGISLMTVAGECLTDKEGTCELPQHLSGTFDVIVNDLRNVSQAEKMMYLLPSLSEIKPVSEEINVNVKNDIKIIVSLGQGFLTTPFSMDVKYKIKNYVDLDKSFCPSDSDPHLCENVRDWNGGKQTYDDHTGIDYNTKKGTPILAVAAGLVTHVGLSEVSGNWGNYIEITHNLNFKTYYGHMDSIEVIEGEMVERGHKVGNVGTTGALSEPHLHLEFKRNNLFIDPYKDLENNNSINYWTKLNDPICPY